MNELFGIFLLLVFIAICAYFDKSGKQGFKRSKLPTSTKTLSSMEEDVSDEYESPGPAFEPSIHDGVSWPGGYKVYLQSPEWKMKREVVLQRDYHTCYDCFTQMSFLEIHHISYDFIYREEGNDYRDLVTLCRRCHQLRHDNGQPT